MRTKMRLKRIFNSKTNFLKLLNQLFKMATNSVIILQYGDGKHICTIYRHTDSQPEKVCWEFFDFLKTQDNMINFDYLAARYVSMLTNTYSRIALKNGTYDEIMDWKDTSILYVFLIRPNENYGTGKRLCECIDIYVKRPSGENVFIGTVLSAQF